MRPQVLSGERCIRSHPHDTGMRRLPWSLIQYVESGPYAIDCAGDRHLLKDNEAWIIPPQHSNRVYAPRKGSNIKTAWIHFRCQLDDGTDLFDHYSFPRILTGRTADKLRKALDEMLYWRDRVNENIPCAVRYEKRMYMFLEFLLSIGEERPFTQQQNSHLIQSVQLTISQQLDHTWNRDNMAALAHLSISRFHDVFKSCTGLAPAQWLREERMKHAKDLLAHSSLRIIQIAKQCGFDDPYHFSRVFKQLEQISPTQWRKNLNN